MRRLQSAQRDFLDFVAVALLENEIGARPGRQDIFAKVHEIDAIPDRRRGVDGLLVGELRIAMEIGFWIGERFSRQR